MPDKWDTAESRDYLLLIAKQLNQWAPMEMVHSTKVFTWAVVNNVGNPTAATVIPLSNSTHTPTSDPPACVVQ